MKLKKNIIAIIPALDRNRYSKNGDLHSWGTSTLLEWKLSQIKKVKNIKDIYVSTPSKIIKDMCKKLGVKTIERNKKDNLYDFHEKISLKFKNNYLLFLNTTSPFLSETIIDNIINSFDKKKNKFDSILTVIKKKDYYFHKNKSVNFDFNDKSKSRSLLSPLSKVTNGAYLIHPKSCNEKKNIIGYKPFFYEVDWMTSLEINSLNDLKIYNLLIKSYFKINR